MSQFDHETVQLTALAVIFDLLHLFGMEVFVAMASEDVTSEADDASITERSDDAMSEIESLMSEMNTGVLDDTNRRNCAQQIVGFLIALLDSKVGGTSVGCIADKLKKRIAFGRNVHTC